MTKSRHGLDRPCLCRRQFAFKLSRYFPLTKIYPGVETSVGTHKVECSLAIVALPGLVDLGLREHDQARTLVIPLQLNLVTLEKALLGDGVVEVRHIEDFHRGRLALKSFLALRITLSQNIRPTFRSGTKTAIE